MNDTVAGLTAGTNTAQLAGRAVVFYPLNMSDIGALTQWLRAQYLAPALEASRSLPPEHRGEFQRLALQDAKRVCFFNNDAWPLMHTDDGMIQTLLYSLRHGDSKLDADSAKKLTLNESGVMDSAGMVDAVNTIYALSGFMSLKSVLELRGKLQRVPEPEKSGEALAPK